MTQPSREEQRQLVRQWDETGRELERERKEALRGMPYRWEDVDALLQLGELSGCPSRTTCGLIEMQRIFMKAHPRRGGSSPCPAADSQERVPPESADK